MAMATPRLANAREADALHRLAAAEKALLEAEADAARLWKTFHGMLDHAFGPDEPALLVNESPPLAAGRYLQERGAGVDPVALALALKAHLSPAAYRKLVTEQKTVTYLVNEAAVQQAADEDEEIAAIVQRATVDGKPITVRIKPRLASHEEIKTAISAARAAQSEGMRKQA